MADSMHKGGLSAIPSGIDRGTTIYKHFYGVKVARAGSIHKGGHSVTINGINLRSLIQKRLNPCPIIRFHRLIELVIEEVIRRQDGNVKHRHQHHDQSRCSFHFLISFYPPHGG